MKTLLIFTSFLLVQSCNKGADPKSEDEKIIYTMGANLGKSVKRFNIKDNELDYLFQGIKDEVNGGATKVDYKEFVTKIQAFTEKRMQANVETEKTASKDFLAKIASEAGAEKTASGLVIKITQKGNGKTPKVDDTISVNYHGTLRDGTVFDSSIQRNKPEQFPLNRVIPCWQEALQKVEVGGKAVIGCPPELAYGDRGTMTIPGGSALKFEVELLEILPPQKDAKKK